MYYYYHDLVHMFQLLLMMETHDEPPIKQKKLTEGVVKETVKPIPVLHDKYSNTIETGTLI